METIPLYVRILARLIPVLKTEGNVSKGEIVKFNFTVSSRNKHSFGDQVVGCEQGFDFIWRHISDDYFKVIGKWPESPFTCQ